MYVSVEQPLETREQFYGQEIHFLADSSINDFTKKFTSAPILLELRKHPHHVSCVCVIVGDQASFVDFQVEPSDVGTSLGAAGGTKESARYCSTVLCSCSTGAFKRLPNVAPWLRPIVARYVLWR